jgi:hypothetical protein
LGATAAVAGTSAFFPPRSDRALAAGDHNASPRVTTVSAETMDGTVVAQWNEIALRAMRPTTLGSPIVARALAILHTCMHDAWAAYDPVATGTRLGGTLRRPSGEHTLANKTAAVSYAAYCALVDLFPAQTALFAQMLGRLGHDPRDRSGDTSRPSGIGNVAAQAVLTFRHHDGANQLGDLHPGAYSDYTGYAPVNTQGRLVDPNRWQPLLVPAPKGQSGLVTQRWTTPHWGRVTPFAMSSGAQFRPKQGPILCPSEGYRRQALQILRYSAELTDEQKAIAEYWADDAPADRHPGHWCRFARLIAARDGHDLDADVALFFALTTALFDAGIAAYDAKRFFDAVRPISAVHYLFGASRVLAWAGPHRGQGWIRGRDWRPYQTAAVVTPAFPEYVSAHSTFSAAAAEALRQMTGSDAFGLSEVIPAGSSLIEPGTTPARDVTLHWATFSAAADQVGLSRRYGGIHFPTADVQGRTLGRQVGAQACARAQAYLMGQA